MSAKFPILLCLAMASMASTQVAPVELDPRTRAQVVGALEFYVLGTYWKPVQYHVESFRASRQPSINLAQNFVGLRIADILTGEYSYALVPNGGETRSLNAKKGVVWVSPGDNWITILAPQYPAGDRSGTIPGVISPIPRGTEPMWVRIQSPYEGEVFVQARVDKKGGFSLPLVAPGNQIVIVCRGEDVLFAMPVHWGLTTQFIRIDVQKNSIEVK